MVIFLNADGSCQKITPRHVYQGSNNVNDITVIAPFADTTALQIGFILPNGLYWETSDGARYVPMELQQQSITPGVNAWHYNLKRSLTEQMGDLYVAINAVTAQGNTTSYLCKVFVEESVLPKPPEEPEPGAYDLLQLYVSRIDVRTENVPYLVKSIQKVEGKDNAFTYTNNSGVTSAPIVIGEGNATPVLTKAAATITIPANAWQPQYSGTDITSYIYVIAAELHQQMRDDAMPNDLWVSTDTADGTDLLGYFPRYTVNASGNITITVNQPVEMTVRVWNGKAGYDGIAREQIAAETERAEIAEQNLQSQIDEIEDSGVDATARAQIAAEIERATAAEQTLGNAITAETSRAEGVESQLRNDLDAEIERSQTQDTSLDGRITTAEGDIAALQTDVTDLKSNPVISIINFTTLGWTDTSQALAYLGTKSIKLTIPTGKQIIQVLEKHPTKMLITPRGTWQDNYIFANSAFNGVAIVV